MRVSTISAQNTAKAHSSGHRRMPAILANSARMQYRGTVSTFGPMAAPTRGYGVQIKCKAKEYSSGAMAEFTMAYLSMINGRVTVP